MQCFKNAEQKGAITIAKREYLTIKIHYISIIFDTATAEEVIRHILQLPVDIFTVFPARVKHKSYMSKYEIGSITVYGNAKQIEDNLQGLGSYLVLYYSVFLFVEIKIYKW